LVATALNALAEIMRFSASNEKTPEAVSGAALEAMRG